MRPTAPVYIAGVSLRVPDRRQSIGHAIAEGAMTAEEAALCDVDSLPVATAGETAEQMALTAARDALSAADISPRAVDFLVYAYVADTPATWKAPFNLARMLGSRRAVAMGLRQACNGGAMAVQLAAAHLESEPRASVCLVLAADALGANSVRRWQLGATVGPMGDGAAALLLSRRWADLRLLSIASSGRPDHEVLFARDDPLVPGSEVAPVELVPTSGMIFMMLRRCVGEAIAHACEDAQIQISDPRIETILFPRVSRATVDTLVGGILSETKAEIVHVTQKTGHLFSGDLLANVLHLIEERPIAAGSLALVVNIGAGFNATCMIVERQPACV